MVLALPAPMAWRCASVRLGARQDALEVERAGSQLGLVEAIVPARCHFLLSDDSHAQPEVGQRDVA